MSNEVRDTSINSDRMIPGVQLEDSYELQSAIRLHA